MAAIRDLGLNGAPVVPVQRDEAEVLTTMQLLSRSPRPQRRLSQSGSYPKPRLLLGASVVGLARTPQMLPPHFVHRPLRPQLRRRPRFPSHLRRLQRLRQTSRPAPSGR